MKAGPSPHHGSRPCTSCGVMVDRSQTNHCPHCGAYINVTLSDFFSDLQAVIRALRVEILFYGLILLILLAFFCSYAM